MSLLPMIRRDQIQARKNRDTSATLLTTLLSEAGIVGKNDGGRESTDAEVVAVVKKFIKNNNEMMSLVNKESYAFLTAKIENALLEQYLPSQLSEDELNSLIQHQIDELIDVNPRAMGSIMKFLKENYTNQYDGGLASKLIREALNA